MPASLPHSRGSAAREKMGWGPPRPEPRCGRGALGATGGSLEQPLSLRGSRAAGQGVGACPSRASRGGHTRCPGVTRRPPTTASSRPLGLELLSALEPTGQLWGREATVWGCRAGVTVHSRAERSSGPGGTRACDREAEPAAGRWSPLPGPSRTPGLGSGGNGGPPSRFRLLPAPARAHVGASAPIAVRASGAEAAAAPGLSGLCPPEPPPPLGTVQGAPPPAGRRSLLDPKSGPRHPIHRTCPRSALSPPRACGVPGGCPRRPLRPAAPAAPPTEPASRPPPRPPPGRSPRPGRPDGPRAVPATCGPDARPGPSPPAPRARPPASPRTFRAVGAARGRARGPPGLGCAPRQSHPHPPSGRRRRAGSDPSPRAPSRRRGERSERRAPQVGGTGAAGPAPAGQPRQPRAPAARDPRASDPGPRTPGLGPRTPDPGPGPRLTCRCAPAPRSPLPLGSGSGSGRAAHGRPLQASPRLRCPRPAPPRGETEAESPGRPRGRCSHRRARRCHRRARPAPRAPPPPPATCLRPGRPRPARRGPHSPLRRPRALLGGVPWAMASQCPAGPWAAPCARSGLPSSRGSGRLEAAPPPHPAGPSGRALPAPQPGPRSPVLFGRGGVGPSAQRMPLAPMSKGPAAPSSPDRGPRPRSKGRGVTFCRR